MVDVDSMLLANDADYTTEIAAHLNHVMARNLDAQAAYARIYGETWQSLGNGMEIEEKSHTPSTDARTIANRAR